MNLNAAPNLPNHPVRRAAIVVVFGIVLTAFLGWAFLRAFVSADPARLLALDPGFLTAAVVVWTLALYCQGARWRALLPFSELPSSGFLALVVGGTNVAHLAVPGPVAEIAAAWFVGKRANADVSLALSATLVGRLLALFALACVVLGATALRGFTQGLPRWVFGVAIAAAAGGFSAGACIVVPGPALSVVAGVLDAVPLPAAKRIAWVVRGWAEGFVAVREKARWPRAFLWSLANASTLSAATVLAFHSANVTIQPLDVLLLHGILSLSTVVMLVLPAGVGAVDALGGGLLLALGVTDLTGAALCMVALRWVQLVSMALGLPAMGWVLAQSRAAKA